MLSCISKALTAVVITTSVAAFGQTPQARFSKALDALLDSPTWRSVRWGVEVVDLETSKVLYARDIEKGFVPASNMKLYTTAAAATALGNDFRYRTNIWATGNLSPAGKLNGDIVIEGSGDPSISGRFCATSTAQILKEWAATIKTAGIREITGSVIGDDDVFDDQCREGTWQIDAFSAWYGAESSGLAMNENCWDMTVKPGAKVGDPAQLVSHLPTAYLTFKNEIVTTTAKGKTAEALKDSGVSFITFSRPLDSNEVTLRGWIPADMEPYETSGSVHNGTLYTATLLTEELQRDGVVVSGGAKDIDDLNNKAQVRSANGRKLIHTHVSPPFSQILPMVNKLSHNFYADQVLKTLAARTRHVGDFDHGRLAVRDFITSTGAAADGFAMLDGSGLSRHNLVEPQMTMALLVFMYHQPGFKAFFDSLPIAGVDGTLRTRLIGTPAQGICHAKTGTLARARALSGYIPSHDKHLIAFTMMTNDYTVDTQVVNDTQDAAILLMANYSEKP